MKLPVHDASARQHSGEPSSGLGPNDGRKDRLRNQNLAELDCEVAGLVDRSTQELRRAWRKAASILAPRAGARVRSREKPGFPRLSGQWSPPAYGGAALKCAFWPNFRVDLHAGTGETARRRRSKRRFWAGDARRKVNLPLSIVKIRFCLPGQFVVAGSGGSRKMTPPTGGPRVRIRLPPAERSIAKLSSSSRSAYFDE
jgi:hypothetical protein